jgi:hypothetical protein
VIWEALAKEIELHSPMHLLFARFLPAPLPPGLPCGAWLAQSSADSITFAAYIGGDAGQWCANALRVSPWVH